MNKNLPKPPAPPPMPPKKADKEDFDRYFKEKTLYNLNEIEEKLNESNRQIATTNNLIIVSAIAIVLLLNLILYVLNH